MTGKKKKKKSSLPVNLRVQGLHAESAEGSGSVLSGGDRGGFGISESHGRIDSAVEGVRGGGRGTGTVDQEPRVALPLEGAHTAVAREESSGSLNSSLSCSGAGTIHEGVLNS